MKETYVKKLTRTGSGTYAIYLPKEWIKKVFADAGNEKEYLVSLKILEKAVLILPPAKNVESKVQMEKPDRRETKQALISAYVNGFSHFTLEAEEGLNEESILEARNVMRFLDETLVTGTDEHRIEFTDRFVEKEFNIEEAISLLFDRVLDAMNLAHEVLTYFDLNPERTIHLMQMLAAIEDRDIDRGVYQIIRNLSKLNFKFRSFIELNYTVLVNDILERVGDSSIGIAELMCDIYGIQRTHLNYPYEILMKEFHKPRFPECVTELKEEYLRAVHHCIRILPEIKEYVQKRDGKSSLKMRTEIARERVNTEKRIFEIQSRITFPKPENIERNVLLSTLQIAHRVREFQTRLESICEQTALFWYSVQAG
ncbi:MAG: hypothetical protein N3F63_01970 [Thermoplasmata archaeon]|nr:hypothetical protein [Thermoplasmata archaeon]